MHPEGCIHYLLYVQSTHLRFLQSCNTFFQRLDEVPASACFLRSISRTAAGALLYKLLIAKFLQYALQETFVFQFGFHTGDFRFYVNHIAQRYGKLGRADHERSGNIKNQLDQITNNYLNQLIESVKFNVKFFSKLRFCRTIWLQ